MQAGAPWPGQYSTGTGPPSAESTSSSTRSASPESDICTDIIEMAQHARPARAQPVVKRAFVGFIHGAEFEEGSMSGGETTIYSDGESSTGETTSLYQLQDGRLGGCSDGDSISDPY